MELKDIAQRLGISEGDAQALLTKNGLNAANVNDAQLIALKRSMNTSLATQSPAQTETKPAAKGKGRGKKNLPATVDAEEIKTNARQASDAFTQVVTQRVEAVAKQVEEVHAAFDQIEVYAAHDIATRMGKSPATIANLVKTNVEAMADSGEIGFGEAINAAFKSVLHVTEEEVA